jgi:hypothetical protein
MSYDTLAFYAHTVKTRKILFGVIGILVGAAVAGRLIARHSALKFGRRLGQTISVLGRDGFADTNGFRSFFANPEMSGYVSRVRQLSFLGGGYSERINDLQAGMIYYSEQVSLPPEKRARITNRF